MSEQDDTVVAAATADEDQNTGQNTPQDAPDVPQGDQTAGAEPKTRKGDKDGVLADLAKERRERQKLQSELQKLKDRDLSELERAQRQATEATKRLEQLEQETLRSRVALRHGIPPEHIHRLQGATEEDLDTDAAALAKILTPKTPRPDPSQGVRGGSSGPMNMNRYIHGLLNSR